MSNTFNPRPFENPNDKFSFFDRELDTRELVTPRLSQWEKSDLNEYLEYMSKESREAEQLSNEVRMLLSNDPSVKKDQKLPKYLLYDIYNKFFSNRSEMKLKTPNKHNRWIFDFLTRKLNTYYVKGMTEQNAFTSALFTKELVYILAERTSKRQQSGGGGSAEDNLKSVCNGMSSNEMNNIMNEVTEKVNQQVEQMENIKAEIGGKDDSKDQDKNDGGKGAGQGDPTMSLSNITTLEKMYKYLYKVNFSDSKLSRFIKDSLKFSTNYFSSIYKDVEEPLLDADDIDSLQGLENLVPVLKKIGLDDIVTYKRNYNFKFDVYIDISGSMGYMNKPNSKLMSAKLVALKLAKLGLVQDMYTFNNGISEKLSKFKMINIDCQGGTTIENVVKQVEKLDRASVIITDAEDSITTHATKAYFIGVPGAQFGSGWGGKSGWPAYINNSQCSLMQKDGSLVTVTADTEQTE